MSNDTTYNGTGNLFSTASNDSGNYQSNSKLVTNSNSFRNGLLSRNLYSLNDQYPIISNNQTRIINSVSSILSLLTPYKAFDLTNTILSKTIDNTSPLTQISLALLGRQFAYNQSSEFAQQSLPTINISNLFNGAKGANLFTISKDYKITPQPDSGFAQFLEILTNSYPSYNIPFNDFSKSNDYLKNTGSGQQDFLLTLLNQNLYKESSNSVLTNVGISIGNPIQSRSTYINSITSDGLFPKKIYFNFNNGEYNPYTSSKLKDKLGEDAANVNMQAAYINAGSIDDSQYGSTQEYVPDLYFIENNLGNTISKNPNPNNLAANGDDKINDWVDNDNQFTSDNITNQLVWGRDGNLENGDTEMYLDGLRGINTQPTPKTLSSLNIKTGLLKYTNDLLNATGGELIDITRKAFVNEDGSFNFNGSALWKSPSFALNPNQVGLRQNTILDQYDRYTKAIRFDGNKVYGGNEKSVIYKSVMPKIHPILDKNTQNGFNNKNMMFSLENLAIKITSSDDTGAMIDDEYGTIIPASEAGSNGGRIMWFPPYNISVFETTAAKFESTVMVGRSEPMYNYQNSERSATLSFTLLIDYPPQLRDQQFKNDNTNKNIAEFFAFGFKGATITKPPTNTTNPKAIKDQQNKIVPTTTTTAPVDTISPSAVNAYFPNDVPNDGQVQRAYQYIFEASYNPSDYNNNGIYNINSDQYKYESGVELNNDLFNIYSKYENADQYTISIVGNASQLYYEADEQVAYNLALGQRRADATKILINARLSDMVAQGCITDDTYNKIKITASSHGSASAPNSTAYPNIPNPTDADKAKVYNNAASIQSRNAIITISKNSTTPPPKDLPKAQQPTAAQHQNNVDTNKTISALAKTAYQQKTAVINPLYDDMFVERGADNTDSNTNNNNSDSFKPLVGFENIAKDYYVPVYHSQTPEEFHRRLTFLNQCMRQGQAQKFDKLTIKNSVFGRQPICVLRIGDFFFTKVIIENLNIDYADCTWDMNPEGFGMQPMIAHITLQMKLIGGQSLAGPINALQNAVAFNYYANSTYTDQGMYYKPSQEEIKQYYQTDPTQ